MTRWRPGFAWPALIVTLRRCLLVLRTSRPSSFTVTVMRAPVAATFSLNLCVTQRAGGPLAVGLPDGTEPALDQGQYREPDLQRNTEERNANREER